MCQKLICNFQWMKGQGHELGWSVSTIARQQNYGEPFDKHRTSLSKPVSRSMILRNFGQACCEPIEQLRLTRKNKVLSQRYSTYTGYWVLWERERVRKFPIPGYTSRECLIFIRGLKNLTLSGLKKACYHPELIQLFAAKVPACL